MPKGIPDKRYTGEFKQRVVETMHREKLSYREAARRFEVPSDTRVACWERINLEEGPEGLYIERRGRSSKGRSPKKLKPEVEEDLVAEVQRLGAENAYLKKIECLGCREGTAREKAKVIWELRHEHKLSLLLDVADLPRSTYYYYTKRQKKPDKYERLKEEISAIVVEHKGRYGYRRVTLELRNRGFHHNHKLIMKLMKQMGLSSKVRMKKYRSYRGEVGKKAPNLLERDFFAAKPNQKWVTDVTEFSLFGVKLYLSPILATSTNNTRRC